MKTTHNMIFRQRRFYLVLPILVIPFLTIIFWAMGGGSGVSTEVTAMPNTGLNLDLPPAQLTNETKMWDKLALYQKAKQDSMKYLEAKRNDPYFRFSTLTSFNEKQDTTRKNVNSSLGKKDPYLDTNEQRVHEKIDALYQQINQPEQVRPFEPSRKTMTNSLPTDVDPDIKRLESMMSDLNAPASSDPEMKQMETMLDKILDIQHPDRVAERIKANKNLEASHVPAVTVSHEPNPVSDFAPALPDIFDTTAIESLVSPPTEENGFFGIDQETITAELSSSGMEAVIHDTQVLVAGSTIKLRLTKALDIKGTAVPAHSFIYGVCSINGERLSVAINSIRLGSTILPVTLSVYDLDGIPGIYIPGAIARDVAKQSTSQSIEDIQLMSLNPSLEVQAAGAGIEAVKGLFTKKIKLIKVTVKAGYRVLLKNQN
jgi:conjugative transposon TraM protein